MKLLKIIRNPENIYVEKDDRIWLMRLYQLLRKEERQYKRLDDVDLYSPKINFVYVK